MSFFFVKVLLLLNKKLHVHHTCIFLLVAIVLFRFDKIARFLIFWWLFGAHLNIELTFLVFNKLVSR